MPPASGAGDAAPPPSTTQPPSTSPPPGDPPGPADPVLAAERDHLHRSREFLRLMREDVLGLEAMAGDRVSQEYLKAELYHRAQALRDIPDVPLFFGRLDYAEGAVMNPGTSPAGTGQPEEEAGGGDGGSGEAGRPGRALPGERLHIGRRHIHDRDGHPVVIDWRAPVSRPFYRASAADPMGLVRRRRFGFAGYELTAYEDEEFTGPGQPTRPAGGPPVSRILIEEIERPRSGPL